ncbi:uracil-DNA glycosylase [Psychrobium sp. nBUS_13]|uniref:uracil-DNA glycosylase n=1 Tax=Psychrobium sp. nBUS_13 TaxID=3395319 RepID=UPI003EBD8FA2
MNTIPTTIHSSWLPLFQQEFSKDYISQLLSYLEQQKNDGIVIYPPASMWFKVFEMPLADIKLIIVGQDPYINENQAMGLSFSVPKSERIPPSLRNIYKELQTDLGVIAPQHGDLSRWFNEESIFLLNASLTVEAGKAGSHLKKGWQQFTAAAIEFINQYANNTVFLAWGAFAHKCCAKIDLEKHAVIKTSHPSPLGAYKKMKTAPAFLESKCFSKANDYLLSKGRNAIDWRID